jgi:hypothetical protein
MVRILVDYYLIASPVPVSDDIVIVRGDIPIEIAKPEAFPVSSRKREYMLRSKTAVEAPVCPCLLDVVMRIPASTSMAHPPIVPGIHVRNIRMTLSVHGNVILVHGSSLPAAFRSWSSRRLGLPGRLRTASRNVSTADPRVTAAVLRRTAPSVLR